MLKKRIKKVRKHLNMTQVELAKKLKVTPGAVSHWECGLTKPSAASIDKIIKIAAKKNVFFDDKYLRG